MNLLHRHLHPGLNLGHTDPETHQQAEETLFGFWIFLMSVWILVFKILLFHWKNMLMK